MCDNKKCFWCSTHLDSDGDRGHRLCVLDWRYTDTGNSHQSCSYKETTYHQMTSSRFIGQQHNHCEALTYPDQVYQHHPESGWLHGAPMVESWTLQHSFLWTPARHTHPSAVQHHHYGYLQHMVMKVLILKNYIKYQHDFPGAVMKTVPS